jgi:hypothetical protein
MSEQPKPKILTRLRIDEVSAVDRGAGERCRIVLSKRANDVPRLNLIDIFQRRITAAEALGIHVNKSAEGDEAEGLIAEPKHVVDNDGADGGVPKKHRSITFDTVDGTRMKFPNERSLAEWLAIQSRISKSKKDPTPMSIDLSAVVKAHGIGALCRHMIKSASSFGVHEHELVQLATEDANRRYPSDSPAMAFSKLFMESSELREAIEIAKNASLQDAVAEELERDSRKACEELSAIGKARWPSLSRSQQFARAAETNPAILNRAHRRPGPSTSFAHPVTKMPEQVSLEPRVADNQNVDDAGEALAQLRQIARDRWPNESEAEAFIRVMSDAEYGDLINRALARPTGSTPPRQS